MTDDEAINTMHNIDSDNASLCTSAVVQGIDHVHAPITRQMLAASWGEPEARQHAIVFSCFVPWIILNSHLTD